MSDTTSIPLHEDSDEAHSTVGHNNPPSFTDEEINKLSTSVADKLAKAIKQGEGADRSLSQSKTLVEEAYAAAHQYFEHLGLPRGDEGGGKVYKKNGHYGSFMRDVADALSKKLGDKVETNAKGNRIYSGRVKKQVSRMVVAYREDADGTQSDADIRNKAIAKLKREHSARKASVFDQIVLAVRGGEQHDVNAIMERAGALYDSCLEELGQLE